MVRSKNSSNCKLLSHIPTYLRSIFITHGLPEVLVSDNGTAFTSAEFHEIVNKNGIRHISTAPYHPGSNGLAERAVQTLKEGMKKGASDIKNRLSRFLFCYRSTPNSTTAHIAELLMGRRPRTHLDLMKPDITTRVIHNHMRQKANHDNSSKKRDLGANQPVFVYNFSSLGSR